MAFSVNIKPALFELYGFNPRVLVATTTDTRERHRLRLTIDVGGEIIATLFSGFVDGQASFNLSYLIPLSYDLPGNLSTQSVGVMVKGRTVFTWTLTEFDIDGELDSQSEEVFAIRGGVNARLARSYQFYPEYQTLKFLTNSRSHTQAIRPDTPVFLYLPHLIGSGSQRYLVNYRATFMDGTVRTFPFDAPPEDTTEFESYTAPTNSIGIIPVGPEALGLPGRENAIGSLVASYSVYVTAQDQGGIASEEIAFEIDRDEVEWGYKTFLFVNSRGGIDTLVTKGTGEQQTDFSAQLAARILQDEPLSAHSDRAYGGSMTVQKKVHIGFCSPSRLEWLRDLGRSEWVWEVIDGEAVPIRLVERNFGKFKDDDDLQSADFTYHYTPTPVL